MRRKIDGGKAGAIILGVIAVACFAIPSGEKPAESDHSMAVKAVDSPAITKAADRRINDPEDPQEHQQAAEPDIEPEAQSAEDVTVRESTQEPRNAQETPQTEVQQKEPKQEQPVQQETLQDEARTVYITPTGAKYHKKSCKTIKKETTALDVNDAIARGYTACKVCGG